MALTTPAEFTVTGSPISTTGTLAITKATQTANQVYAGPATGAAVVPTFRALAPADLPIASTALLGAIKPDGTTITVTAGGVISGGAATLPTGAANLVVATPNGTSGASSLRALVAADLPLATATTFGAVKPDGTSVTVTAGVLSAAGTAGSIVANPAVTQTINQPSGTGTSFNVQYNGTTAFSVGGGATVSLGANLASWTTSIVGGVVSIGSTAFSGAAVNVVSRSVNLQATGLFQTATVQSSGGGNVQLSASTVSGVQGSVVLTSSVTLPIARKTAAYTATYNDRTIQVDATTGPLTITLPAAQTGVAVAGTGVVFTIKKVDSSVNAVTVVGQASTTLDGAASIILATQNAKTTVQSDGTNWFVVA